MIRSRALTRTGACESTMRSTTGGSEQGSALTGSTSMPVARRLGAAGIVRILRGSHLDAAVIDVKDSEGRVSFDSRIAELAPAEHLYFRDLPAFVRELRAAGIYTIARVVCFSDPVLPKLYPDRAVRDTRPGHVGAVWNAHKKWSTWLDPYDTRNMT